MLIKHEGFQVTCLPGGATAKVTENPDGYTEINLTDLDGSYDMSGLDSLISDLRSIAQLTAIHDSTNREVRHEND